MKETVSTSVQVQQGRRGGERRCAQGRGGQSRLALLTRGQGVGGKRTHVEAGTGSLLEDVAGVLLREGSGRTRANQQERRMANKGRGIAHLESRLPLSDGVRAIYESVQHGGGEIEM